MHMFLVAISLLVSAPVFADQFTKEQYEGAQAYITECATDWANSVVTGDSSRMKVYFAEDFQGTGIDGSRYDKTAVTQDLGPSTTYVSNVINGVDVRFFGTTAIAYGDETWTKTDGSSGKWIWTDVWKYRNGGWQIIAAQDVEVSNDK
jgi:hypothetical protein